MRWTCHICGRERPDDKISVYSRPIIVGDRIYGTENIRYCNDNPECVIKARSYSFLGTKPPVKKQ